MDDTSPEDTRVRHEELLERLSLLADSADLDQAQRELARAWRRRLEAVEARVRAPLSVAFLAQVGRGKSTLIAAATGLRLPEEGSPKRWSVLPVGDGRTTLGETRIEFHDRDDILLRVEPIAERELRMELRLFARDLWKSNVGKGDASSGDGSAGEELYGMLRAWLVPGEGDRRKVLNELSRAAVGAEALEQELLSRIDLEQRNAVFERSFARDREGLTGLRDALRALMRGELPDAPAPQVVRLRLPRNELGKAVDAIIDTQGIDATATAVLIGGRPDLQERLADPDTLLVLCSEFGSAPDLVTLELLRALGEEETSTRAWRMVIVDDRDLADDPSERAREERERTERIEQCRDRLRREGLPVEDGNVVAIDARQDAEVLQGHLAQMVDEERHRRVETWRETLRATHAATSALHDVDVAARQRELDLRLWWAWDAVLAEAPDGPIDGLMVLADLIEEGAHTQHWSHLYAASRRRGRYGRLRLDLLGAKRAAMLDTSPHISALKAFAAVLERFSGDLQGYSRLRYNELVFAATDIVNDNIEAWRQAFSRYFESPDSDDLWLWCENRWGQGQGYVKDVAERFRQEAQRKPLQLDEGAQPILPNDILPPRPPLFSLRKIEVRNFRGITHRSIPIAPTTTVLVGDNGLGKTGWLEAIAASVGVLLPGMGAGPAPALSKNDVRQVIRRLDLVADRQPQLPMTLEVEATVQGRPLRWVRRMDVLDDDAVVTDDEGLQVMAQKIGEEIRAHFNSQLPVLAYYGTKRLWPTDIEPNGARREVSTRLDGYRDCLEAASTHQFMQDWVRHYTMVGLQHGKPVPQLQAIERAVVCCVEEAERFYYDLALEDLVLVLRDGSTQPFRTLSDGYRNIVAMVADIAWRASALNPQLRDRAPALAEGVVLIDEIDLHLHPRWQRRVLADLRRAFPRLQIITTTHSPFIIQSLEPGQLVNLDPTADEDAPYANESPEDIAEHIMGVDVPQRSERRTREYEVAKRYYELLERFPKADEAELAKAKDELDELLAPYSDNQAFVAFLELKRAAAEATRR